VQINPPQIGAADGLRLYHCRFYDCGEQIIKGNFLYDNQNLPRGPANGSIEYCVIEYTAWGPIDGYTEGIDLHAVENWNICNNLLCNIRVPENSFHTHVPAILIWNNAKNVNVNSNTFINCDRGIAYGLADRTNISGYPEVNTGIISNNVIYRQQNEVIYNDAGILAWDVRAVKIINNTVFDEVDSYPAIEYRYVKNTTDVTIVNNLVNPCNNELEPSIWDRDNDLGNPQNDYQNATVASNFSGLNAGMLNAGYPGDLHLNPETALTLFGIDTHPDCNEDFDGEQRPPLTHYGADNYFAGALATHSFTNYNEGTHPNSLSISGNEIQVDLSALSGAHIYRAHFNPGKNFNYYNLTANSLYNTSMTLLSGTDTLELLSPRYKTFDATTATISANSNSGILTLQITEAESGFGDHLSLDVLCDHALPSPIAQVTQASAIFRDGDAMISFAEVAPPLSEENPGYETFFNTYNDVLDGNVRYRIYRSASAIETTADMLNAELIDEIYPLSGWNPKFHGPERVFPFIGKQGTVTRLPIDDEVLADVGTGIYVNRYLGEDDEQQAFYFISHTLNGAEDFSAITSGGNATNPVIESEGNGCVLLHSVVQSPDFTYEGPCTLHYYVKWERPPAGTFPNDASNYLVALRDDIDYSAIDPGVIIKLHSWGGTMNHSFGWWHYADQGHILVSGNQFPWQSWWLGHHSSLGTLKSYNEGTIQPFCSQRFLDFVFDFLEPAYSIDKNKIVLSGTSMGATGTSITGTRNGHIFSNLIGWVGVHNPAESPTFEPSFELAFGDSALHCSFSNVEFAEKYGGEIIRHEDNYDVWRYYNNALWLNENPGATLPWHTFSNGSNDAQIGWLQAQEYVSTAMDHKAPFNFTWGTNGHDQRARILDPYGYETDRRSNIVFSLNQSHPSFSNSTMAGDIQNNPEGQINNYFTWETASIIDNSTQWEINISLIDEAPQETVSTCVSPRRLQNFEVSPDQFFYYSWYEQEQLISSGMIQANTYGAIDIFNLEVTKDYRTLKLTPSEQTLLSTLAPTAINAASATLNGNISTLGNPTPTQHGFCWSIATNPTIENNFSDLGAANLGGDFSSDIEWLTGNTTYYVRAYATSAGGTVYGNEINFTTGDYESIVWTGAHSADWNSALNWDAGLRPTQSHNVLIPAFAIENPILSGGGTADCHNLTLEGDASLTLRPGASLISTGTISGNENIAQEANFSAGEWHLISPPIENATSGVFQGHFLQRWHEASAEWINITSTSALLLPLEGYSFWGIRGKVEFVFSGKPNTGTIQKTVTLSGNFPDPGEGNDGANLLGNPYPSSIDWSGLDDTWGAVYYWDPSANSGAGDYIEWNDGVGSGSQFIPPMQGFFIVVDESNTSEGSGTFSLSNENRIHSGATGFHKSKIQNGLVMATHSGENTDELFIRFAQDATNAFDLKKDALKFFAGAEGVAQIYSFGNSHKLAIDTRPETGTIQLGFVNDISGFYAIAMTEANGISKATLEDTKENVFHDLTTKPYEFAWDVTDDEKRFKLHLNAVGIEETPISESDILIYAANKQIIIKGAESGRIMVSDIMGRVVLQQEISGQEINSIPVNLQTGVYVVMVTTGIETKSEKVFIK